MAERVTFVGSHGEQLAGRLEMPPGAPEAMALFAHCFTCSKDVAAASRVSRALTRFGIGVLRFDFTGLGNSDGDFANTTFSSNVKDLLLASEFLASEYQAPRLLVGHSLGGAAVLRAAARLPSVQAVATIGAPSSPEHVTQLLAGSLEEIEKSGRGEVCIGGRSFTIQKDFVEDVRSQSEGSELGELKAAKLIFHSPTDEIVGIENARKLYDQLKHPKSFVVLDGADHLLSDRRDSEYVASVLSAWASRYLETGQRAERPHTEMVVVEGRAGSFRTRVSAGEHSWIADEPEDLGGTDRGPSPYDMLLAALGACTSMTLHMYAARKELSLEQVTVSLAHERLPAEDGKKRSERLTRDIRVSGDLSDEQRNKLQEIANKCPVHRTLTGDLHVETRLVEAEEKEEP